MVTTVRPRGLVEVLPNLLRDKAALKYKHPELQAYISKLDECRFYEKPYLEGVKAHMEKQRLVFWKRLDVTIMVEPALGLFAGRVRAVTSTGTPQRVLDFYHTNPASEGRECAVVEVGSNLRPWVMRCGSSLGVHGTKRVARMIAIIKECVDPDFDLEGDSPPPPACRRNLKRTLREMDSGAVLSPEYHDADEAPAVADKVQRCNEKQSPANFAAISLPISKSMKTLG